MKFAKSFVGIIVVLALAGAGIWHFWLKDQAAFGQVATAYAAKQICSCRFVSERDMESCKTDFTQDISQLKISEFIEELDTGETTQGVTASALGVISATASYEPGLGCVLQN